ncbi:hypothetical protein [Legionella sp.]|uniref:hypothetical protein n=1 Tax=Legionella sp. TaxID=459 RepID=UPI003C9D032F
MIIYSPIGGEPLTYSLESQPRHCFLMTRLGFPIPKEVTKIRDSINKICKAKKYKLIDASTDVTGGDYLLKIWKTIASTPISIGICHEDIPKQTQENIYYEIGAAQAMGKETIIIKSIKAEIPSDFKRTEYIEFNNEFNKKLRKYFTRLEKIAYQYETMADQFDPSNPILAIDYLKRAFLICGDERLRKKALVILQNAGLQDRAKNSVEILAANF